MFSLKVSAGEQHLFALHLQLGGLGYVILCPWLLIYDFSVLNTEYLAGSVIGIEKYDQDFYFESVSVNKCNHQQHMDAVFSEELGQLLLFCSNGPLCEPDTVTFPHGCLYYL